VEVFSRASIARMFLSEKFIYLQLQKTACTHIAELLGVYFPGVQRGKHGQLTMAPGGRLVIGSVRNPWDWYVSLWAYGCQSHGEIYDYLTSPFPAIAHRIIRGSVAHPRKWARIPGTLQSHAKKKHERWQRLYASSDDPELFREWLKCLFSIEGKSILGKEYPHLPMNSFVGLMTYRFFYLFIDYKHWHRSAHRVESMLDLVTMYDRHAIADRFIKMESLEHDLAKILIELGVEIGESELKRSKVNSSSRLDMTYYYDEETVELVRDKEQFIIERFKYAAPWESEFNHVGR
jgi:hypothetical protein